MPTTYKGLTVPLSSDLADGPAAFRDYTDSLPYKVFATVADRDAVTAPPDGSLCFTADTGTLWLRKAGVWQPVQPDEGVVFADIGSKSGVGVYDIAVWAPAPVPYPVRLTVNAVVEFGFAATGPASASADIYRNVDAAGFSSNIQSSPVAQWSQITLSWSWTAAANADHGFKVRGNITNLAGGNCWLRAFATYQARAI